MLYLNNKFKLKYAFIISIYKRWALTSQLQAVYARKAFISFDEPEFKATFKVRARYHKSLHALSNMPIMENKNL
jgi:aminopeptidase N